MPAIRTVSETDDVHIIEGYGPAFGGPFNGRDSYRTFASARTNFHWDLFPDSMDEPKFTRPVNYQHGFDSEIGLSRVGGWSPVRADDQGIWIRAQLDKHHAYYGALRELLGADALAFSPESAEHASRMDERTGEWLDWPAIAMALTPTPSNPFSIIAARSADTLRIVAALGKPEEPATAVRYSPAADHAAMGAGILGSLLYLISCEADEPEQLAMLQTAADSITEWIAAERAEIGTDAGDEMMPAYMTAVRAGKRNSAADLSHVDAIHEHTVALGTTSHAETPPASTSDEPPDEAARSGDPVPTISFRIVEPVDPNAERRTLAAFAETVAAAALRGFRGEV